MFADGQQDAVEQHDGASAEEILERVHPHCRDLFADQIGHHDEDHEQRGVIDGAVDLGIKAGHELELHPEVGIGHGKRRARPLLGEVAVERCGVPFGLEPVLVDLMLRREDRSAETGIRPGGFELDGGLLSERQEFQSRASVQEERNFELDFAFGSRQGEGDVDARFGDPLVRDAGPWRDFLPVDLDRVFADSDDVADSERENRFVQGDFFGTVRKIRGKIIREVSRNLELRAVKDHLINSPVADLGADLSLDFQVGRQQIDGGFLRLFFVDFPYGRKDHEGSGDHLRFSPFGRDVRNGGILGGLPVRDQSVHHQDGNLKHKDDEGDQDDFHRDGHADFCDDAGNILDHFVPPVVLSGCVRGPRTA